ncbi:chemotaxis protein CheW [Pseudalkalibacillus berkeleyi]|uniref:Chemotaxis protein CheW n=1 Tax=Pseudalkalibacillus berkeleyi TaxID=1069813 RepID=A0ABS9H460_9BACL|nr:chemotaxis protein CheW [Pseudalkalibacillus berkeleyi]MCF6138711.1 chemotaxis protein CheW [Pseudalkalibacillus berkeleyi]
MSKKKVIVFNIGTQEYCLDIEKVTSIERMQSVTELPLSEAYMKGVINLRGNVIPIISLKEKFFQVVDETDSETRIIIVPLDDGTEVGVIVDQATDVLDVDIDQIQPYDGRINSIQKEFIEGVVNLDERILVLLDIEKVLVA